jgi:hypothetical protein
VTGTDRVSGADQAVVEQLVGGRLVAAGQAVDAEVGFAARAQVGPAGGDRAEHGE